MRFKLDHVAIAVRDVEQAAKNFEKLGLTLSKKEEVADQQALVAFFDVGGAHLELTAPLGEGALQRSIEKRGEGLHHICLEVEDLEEALAFVKAAGLGLVDEKPRLGSRGTKIAFLHPKGLNGVLVELVEKP